MNLCYSNNAKENNTRNEGVRTTAKKIINI